jgi:hypothetical protein
MKIEWTLKSKIKKENENKSKVTLVGGNSYGFSTTGLSEAEISKLRDKAIRENKKYNEAYIKRHNL